MPYGQDAVVGIAMQNSFGTAANVGSLHHIPLLNEDVGLVQQELLSQNLTGRFDEGDSYSGTRRFDGTIECEAQPKALGALLTATINDPATTTSGSVGTFVFKPRTSDWDAFSPNRPVTYFKDLKEAGSAQLFYDLCGTRFEVQQSAEGFLIARASFVAGKTSTSSASLTADTGRRWPWNQASLSLNGSGVADFRDITITHDEGIQPRWYLDGNLTAGRSKREANRTVRVSGTIVFETQSHLNDLKNETTQPFILTWKGSTAIQSGFFDTFQIIIPAFRWIDFKPAIRGAGPLEVQFTGRGQYHSGSGTTIQYTLQNTWSAGYV